MKIKYNSEITGRSYIAFESKTIINGGLVAIPLSLAKKLKDELEKAIDECEKDK